MSTSSPSSEMQNEIYIDGKSTGHGQYHVRERQNEQNVCKQWFRLIRRLWATQHTEKFDSDEDMMQYAKTTIRELTVYMTFIGILSIVVFGMVSNDTYTMTQALKGVFVDSHMTDSSNNKSGASFTELTRMEEFWEYMTEIAAPGLFTETWYNENNVSEYGYVLYENRLLGAVQMRQKRVRNNSCIVADDFRQEIKFCFNGYAPAFEDKTSFGPCENLDADNCTDEAYKHTPPKSLFSSSITGKVGVYDKGGFIKTFSSSQEQFKNEIEELKENLWITRGTRAIIFDFTVYNANMNLFCQVQLLFEFPAVGGVVTSSKFRAVKLLRYVNAFDYFVLSCEIIFLFFVIYYTIEEILEISNIQSEYFKFVMNWLDIIVICLSYVSIAFNIYRQVQVDRLLDRLLDQQPGKYSDFSHLCYWQYQFNNLLSATIFLAWIKIFKYVSFNKTMTQLSETLTKCAKDISGFAIMFFIIFFAFAQLGYLTFGTQIEGFRAFQYSVYTLFLVILGSFDFPALQQAHRVLGPIFFLAYVFFVFFVLMNMFLAIINDTYMEVKAELQNKKSKFDIGNYVKQSYAKVRERLRVKHDRIVDIRRALSIADMNNDKLLEFEEWRTEMKARGYAEEEIETMFAKYDTDGNRVLDEDEQRALSNDLLQQNNAVLREMKELNMKVENKIPMKGTISQVRHENQDTTSSSNKQSVTVEEYKDLNRRIEAMESSVECALSKIDGVASNLGVNDQTNSTLNIKSRNRPTSLQNTTTTNSYGDTKHSMINIDYNPTA